MKKAIVIVLLLAAAGGAGWWFWFHGSDAPLKYRFAKVERGDIKVTVNATGTVQPYLLVQVGTQVTGTIQKLLVDFNSQVKKGDLVAQIDPAPFQAKVDQDKANLARAQADVIRVKAMAVQAEKELGRSRELQKKDLISGSELDAAVATYESSAAQVKVAEASVAQAQAALESSQVNLRYTTIVSPIDGVVISRNVDVGQTVAASLQGPHDLRHRGRHEEGPDPGKRRRGRHRPITETMNVSFTVDAHKDERFRGKVFQIRLSPTTVQNVVTYTVMIDAENPGNKLLPGNDRQRHVRHCAVPRRPEDPERRAALHAARRFDRLGETRRGAAGAGPGPLRAQARRPRSGQAAEGPAEEGAAEPRLDREPRGPGGRAGHGRRHGRQLDAPGQGRADRGPGSNRRASSWKAATRPPPTNPFAPPFRGGGGGGQRGMR
jgi:HlyD family secretion protein